MLWRQLPSCGGWQAWMQDAQHSRYCSLARHLLHAMLLHSLRVQNNSS
jgi:hypothetical protein